MAGCWPLRQDLFMRVCDQIQKHAKDILAGHSGRSRAGKMGPLRPLGEPVRAQNVVQIASNMNKGHFYLPSCYKALYSENAPLLFLS